MKDDDKKNTADSKKLVAMCVRFNPEAMNVINRVCKLNHISKAQFIRYCVDDRLAEHLKHTRLVDEEQADMLREEIYILNNALQEIRLELNRIGVNYNQAVRLQNIKNKYPDIMDTNLIQRRIEEEDEAILNTLSKEELDSIISRFEAATKKAGDAICAILG